MNDNDTNSTDKPAHARRPRWNKGKLVGPKPPLRPSHVWSIRTKLQLERRKFDLALLNLAINSKRRGCDVVAIPVDDVAPCRQVDAQSLAHAGKTKSDCRHHKLDHDASAIEALFVDLFLDAQDNSPVRIVPDLHAT